MDSPPPPKRAQAFPVLSLAWSDFKPSTKQPVAISHTLCDVRAKQLYAHPRSPEPRGNARQETGSLSPQTMKLTPKLRKSKKVETRLPKLYTVVSQSQECRPTRRTKATTKTRDVSVGDHSCIGVLGPWLSLQLRSPFS